MTDSPRDKVHTICQVASPSSASPVAQALSPLAQLLPTGYRDIQPFQKGKGWHTNGPGKQPQTSKFRRPRDAIAAENGESYSSNSEKVVFPVIPAYKGKRMVATTKLSPPASAGPQVSAVDLSDGDERQESEERSRMAFATQQEEYKPPTPRTSSPSIASIPVPPSAPRRPSQGDNNQSSGSSSNSSNFRTRAIAAAIGSNAGHPRPSLHDSSSPAQPTTSGLYDNEVMSSPSPQVPDPTLVAKLWEEYAERTKSKSVDKEAYHRKMQHKYSELKVMRERVNRLESELAETQRERDKAREVASRSVQQNVVARWKDSDSSEELGSEARPAGLPQQQSSHTTSSPSLVSRRSMLKVLQNLCPEEVSYREKCFKLERALATTKATMSDMQTTLAEQHERDRGIINMLQAKLLLEQETSQLLSKQLHEANVSFKATADELVATQIELEKEQIHKKIVVEQIQEQTNQLITDHRRKELQNRVRNVVRNMGKEALHQKMEALHTRVLVAEQNMRKAQLQVTNLKAERDAQQQQLEQILSSSALKYHSLAGDGGIPGILQRATQLYYGSRVVTSQVLMVQILYEDEREPYTERYPQDQMAFQVDAFGNEAFRIHFVCYEAFTVQDDFLTFQLRDIKRLVPDHENYLACYADRKRERLQELAEILFEHVHAGYKNGHLVITEIPSASLFSSLATQNSGDAVGIHGGYEESDRREVNIYRATQYLPLQHSNSCGREEDYIEVLAELMVNEVCAASTSELWWLEVRALVLESDGLMDPEETELVTKVDQQQLRSLCLYFGSYRPSESMAARSASNQRDGSAERAATNASEIFSIHEELLEPVLSKLVFISHQNGKNDGADQEIFGGGADPSDDERIQLVLDLPSATDTVLADHQLLSETAAISLNNDTKLFDDASATTNSARYAQDSCESVLDYRCIVNISDVFYCVRIQELWDAELMLKIDMEDPETLCEFHRVIRESELMDIAGFLFDTGSVDENCASQVKNGLPRKLHVPICKLLKKHMQPVVVSDSATDIHGNQAMRDTVAEISIASLTKEVAMRREDQRAVLKSVLPASHSNSGSSKWRGSLEPLERGVPSELVGKIASQLANRLATGTRCQDGDGQHRHQVQRARRGCRSVRSKEMEYVMVEIWSGFQGFDGLVLEIFPLSSPKNCNNTCIVPGIDDSTHDERLQASRLVITIKPLNQALGALGLAFPPT